MFVTSHIDAGEAPRYTFMWGSYTHFLLSEDNSSLKFGGTTIHPCLSVMLKVLKQYHLHKSRDKIQDTPGGPL